jgi:ParB family chromosome partitioning protein
MAESSKPTPSPKIDSKAAQPKSSVVSRLGRGLGALIPAAPGLQMPFSGRGVSGQIGGGTSASSNSSSSDSVAIASAAGTSDSTSPSSSAGTQSANSLGRTATGAGIETKAKIGQTPSSQGRADDVGQGDSPTTATTAKSQGAGTAARGIQTFEAAPEPLERANAQAVLGASERSTGNTVGIGEAVQEIQISLIARNTRQPRERFDGRAIAQLADSIGLHGLLQPITVRKLSSQRGGKTFELIAGERRLKAFEVLKRSAIPALVRVADDSQSATLALIENIQREDLNPMERAKGLERLIGEFGWTQQQAGERVGFDRATVANLLRLNDLDSFTASCVRDGRLSQGHAKALLAIDNPQIRRSIAERALHDEWSVRHLEREVQRKKGPPGVGLASAALPPRRTSVPITDLERRLGAFLGTKIAIRKGRKSGSGSMTIKFFSLDQFDGILNRLGFDPNNLSD